MRAKHRLRFQGIAPRNDSPQCSGGADLLEFERGTVTLASGIRLLGFDGANQIFFGNNTRVVKVGKLSTGASIEFTSGIDDTQIAINSMSFTAAGGISFLAGEGRNELQLTSPSGRIALGIRINNETRLAVGALPTGESVNISGGINIVLLVLGGPSIALRGGIALKGGAGNDRIEIEGTVKIGKSATGTSIQFDGGDGNDRVPVHRHFHAGGHAQFHGWFGGRQPVYQFGRDDDRERPGLHRCRRRRRRF